MVQVNDVMVVFGCKYSIIHPSSSLTRVLSRAISHRKVQLVTQVIDPHIDDPVQLVGHVWSVL